MSEVKFTPGEWSVSEIKVESYGYSANIVSIDQMATIAELKATTTSMVDWLPNAEGFKANLSLLKSAPKMYSQLSKLKMFLYDINKHVDDDFFGFGDAIISIEDLLAEARGE